MNHQIGLAIDADILGDGYLHERFTAYVEILGYFVRQAPRPVRTAWVAEMTDNSVVTMKRHLHELRAAGMIERQHEVPGMWHLVKRPCDVTLDEVFRCAVAACGRRRSGPPLRTAPAGSQDVELLLMQALQAVDDHLYRSLRTYSLDRLTASSVAPLRRCGLVTLFAEVE